VATARWMKRWLLKQDEAFDEPDFPIATDAELQCTRSGQVLVDFKGVSVFELNRERERELRKDREAAHSRLSANAFRAEVRKRLGLAQWKSRRLPVQKGNLVWGNVLVGASPSNAVDPGTEMMVTDLRRERGPEDDPTLVVVGGGWVRLSGVPKGYANTYSRVVQLDLLAQDSSVPAAGKQGRDSPFGADWREAFMALSMDKPLLGQRTAELLDILESLHAGADAKKSAGFHVVGVGPAGPAVLHAALLDERGLIKKVMLRNSLVSWANIIENSVSRDQLGNVVPGVLQVYDLPDLAARLAPLPLSILGSVDTEGKAVPVSQVRESYAGCIKSYGSAGPLEIR